MLDVAELRKKWSAAVAADDKSGDLDNCAAGFAREHVPTLLDEIEAERAIADTEMHRRIAEIRKLADEP